MTVVTVGPDTSSGDSVTAAAEDGPADLSLRGGGGGQRRGPLIRGGGAEARPVIRGGGGGQRRDP